MADSPSQAFNKCTLRFDGKKLDAINATFTASSSRMGGIAAGADGNLFHYTGSGQTHSISGVEFFVRKSGLVFKPWEHTEQGQEFDASFQQGDPAFGGKTITFTQCLCKGETQAVDNGQGLIKVSIPSIEAVDRNDR